tara:strand:+ start:1561 stop:2187 length:627 start_codon:yes stop_codon:yes gene_type:complete
MTTAPAKYYSKKPPWLKVPFPGGDRYSWIKSRSTRLNLSTVCEEANCPNIGECWNGGTATFMLMGDTCTRGCRFCAVKSAKYPPALDADEPSKLAGTIKKMNLNYVVLTTVNRDDLPDQGASHISRCIKATQKTSHRLLIEMLMPDFRGEKELIRRLLMPRLQYWHTILKQSADLRLKSGIIVLIMNSRWKFCATSRLIVRKDIPSLH